MFKILNSQAPGYLTELLSQYNPTRCLRSSSDSTRLVLHSSATAIGNKRFQTVAAKSCNLLPTEIRTVTSIVTFKKLLKTYLFWFCAFNCIFGILCKRHGTLVNDASKWCVLLLLNRFNWNTEIDIWSEYSSSRGGPSGQLLKTKGTNGPWKC